MDYKLLGDSKVHGQKKTINNWLYDHGMVAMVIQFQTLLQALVTIGISIALTVEFFRARAQGDGELARFLNHWSFPVLFLVLFALAILYNNWAEGKTQKRQ